MKTMLLIVALVTLAFDFGRAQDGLLISAKPPIVVRRDVETVTYYFTNTGEKPLHGITIHGVKDGNPNSTVVIDTIEPHKTVGVDLSRILQTTSGSLREATVTCKTFSSPIKLLP